MRKREQGLAMRENGFEVVAARGVVLAGLQLGVNVLEVEATARGVGWRGYRSRESGSRSRVGGGDGWVGRGWVCGD